MASRGNTRMVGDAASPDDPGLFDIQVNGGLGVSFNSPTLTATGVRTVAELLQGRGVTGFLPTLITGPPESLAHGFRTLESARETDPFLERMIPGYHLEGPYISPQDGYRGAHPLHHIREPDWDEFRRWNDAAGGRIRLVTLAPEVPGGLRFIERLAEAGIVVALGHTAADGATIRDAVKAGVKLSTHLGNGCPALLARHPNPIWDQLAEDGLWASVIADGHHLPRTVLQTILRAKPNVVLTSDLSSLAGLVPGRYRDWEQDLEVTADGRVLLAGTPYLAGAGRFLDECVTVAAEIVGKETARTMAADLPRKLFQRHLLAVKV